MANAQADILEYVDCRDPAREGFSSSERAVLDQVNRRVAGAESLDGILHFLFETTRGLNPCDRLGLAFVEEEGRRLVAHYVRADYAPLLLKPGYAEDLGVSSLQAVLAEGRVRIIHDLEAYLQLHPGSRATRLLVDEGVRSSMTCPLAVEGRRVGVLFRSARQTRAYSRYHARLHMTVAERLAQAVEKARRIEQLEEARRIYAEMLGFVSHELKSPLSAIIISGELLREGHLGALSGQQHEKVAGMVQRAEHMMELVKDYLDLSRLDGGEMRAELQPDLDLADRVLRPALEIVRPKVEDAGVYLETALDPGTPRVPGDPALLKIAVVNLLDNAVKYSRPSGHVRIGLAPAEPGGLVLRVWNEGPGFAPEERRQLFRRFSRIPAPALMERPGTGLGLYTSWRIVRLHGGKMEADSSEGEWAEFSFILPAQTPADRESVA
jgi:hypothetical protein